MSNAAQSSCLQSLQTLFSRQLGIAGRRQGAAFLDQFLVAIVAVGAQERIARFEERLGRYCCFGGGIGFFGLLQLVVAVVVGVAVVVLIFDIVIGSSVHTGHDFGTLGIVAVGFHE